MENDPRLHDSTTDNHYYNNLKKGITFQDIEKMEENENLKFQRYFEDEVMPIEMENGKSNLDYKENLASTSNSDDFVEVIWENKIMKMVDDLRKKNTRNEKETLETIDEIDEPDQPEETLAEDESSSLLKSEVHVVEKNMEVNYNDVDERHNQPSDKYLDMIEECNRMEETEKKQTPAAEVENNDKTNKSVRKPIVWNETESNLKKKIKKLPWIEGVIGFSYDRDPFRGARHYTLATFNKIIYNERCDYEGWYENLQDLVKKMKINRLYVQGHKQMRRLRQKIDTEIVKLPKRDPYLKCKKCNTHSCNIFKVKNFFQTFHYYNLPIECRRKQYIYKKNKY